MSPEVTIAGSIFKLLLSLTLGSIVGLERKTKGQMAGDRTFALISMGATLAMILSIYIPQEYLGLKNGDPGRIAAQVLTGIGFLGAGAIMQTKGSVRGLTTAAGIWMMATIGLAIGVGMYMLSIISTALVLFILVSLERYDQRWHSLSGQSKVINIVTEGIIEDFTQINQLTEKHNVHIQDRYIKHDYSQNSSAISLVIFTKDKIDFCPLFNDISHSMAVRSITLANDINI